MKFHIVASLITACSALATEAPSKFQLKYFDIRGVAEPIRLLFALGEEDFEDVRFEIGPSMESPQFNEAKENGDLMMNLNRAPILITPDGATIGQSKAIERFLARRFQLMGSNEVEGAQIDCVVEHCQDVRMAQRNKRFSAFVKDRTDEEKAESQKEWFGTDLPGLLSKIEKTIEQTSKAKGCAVGSCISLADVAIFSLLKDAFPAYLEPTLKAAEGCPHILAIIDAVEHNSKISKWLAERPQTSF